MNPFKRRSEHVQSVVLDTSGIIDGRVVEIARAGFVPQNIVVPQFVIAELQFLADHGDTHKRERARYGLDVIRELQDVRRVEVSISREKFEHIREVDDKLVALAKRYGALLYTTDFNLNKVAQIEGVTVLNVNELAHALRPNLLPGERVSIKLTQVGQDKTQGVGYLGDGTMVVVEQASRYVGQQVQATCTRILQTQAGKMMFATLANAPAPSAKQAETPRQESRPHPIERKAVAHFPAPAPQQRTQQHTNRRRHGAYGNDQADSKQASPRPEPAKQPQTAPQAPKQRPARQANQNKPALQHSRQAQQQPSQNAPKQQSRQRPSGNKRRLSPEDSLIATLNEIDAK